MLKFQQHALRLDNDDPLKSFQDEFLFPVNQNGEKQIYLSGHSLGLQPKQTEAYIKTELTQWANLAVEAHFSGEHPWINYHETVTETLAKLTGALSNEVVAMNSLTANLHLMLISFYRPTKNRYKILIEQNAFPSDRYAIHSQLQFHGYDIDDALIEIEGNTDGIFSLARIEDIFKQQGDAIALVLLSGVQFKTGQVLPMEKIIALSHHYQCVIGLDLAHAIGNIALELHRWQCDFAVWCHYKYLNAGPGAIGGCFIHQNHFHHSNLPRLTGWWGHQQHTRFEMLDKFVPYNSAAAWQLSNPPIFQLAALRASLEIFSRLNFQAAINKTQKLTEFARQMLQEFLSEKLKIITPAESEQHGAQLSLKIKDNINSVVQQLKDNDIIVDSRSPDIIRIAPTPLYNSFQDVYQFVNCLAKLL